MQRVIICLFIVSLIGISGCATNGQAKSKMTTDELFLMIEDAQESYKLGLLTDAEIKYRQITEKYPNYYDAWLKLGNIYVRTDQLMAAIRIYENCTKIDPEAVQGWNNLALARLKQAMNTLKSGRDNMTKGSVEFLELDQFYKSVANVIAVK